MPCTQVPVCYFQRYGHEYALHLKPEPLPKVGHHVPIDEIAASRKPSRTSYVGL